MQLVMLQARDAAALCCDQINATLLPCTWTPCKGQLLLPGMSSHLEVYRRLVQGKTLNNFV